MPYINFDDDFTEHPKVDALSDGAFRLWASGVRYAAKNLTDGLIPAVKVDRLKPNFKAAHLNELVRSGVWHKGGEGCGTDHCPRGSAGEYVVHDYLQWNKPRDWWLERRKAETERRAAHRRAKKESA